MRSHKFFSVFLLSAITAMIIVSFIFWGIGPRGNPAEQFVAQVEGKKIPLDVYWRAYDNQYKQLTDQYSEEEIEEMNLSKRVLDGIVAREVLLLAADEAGVTVTEEELQKKIRNMKTFQREGSFDQDIYRRALQLNRVTPQDFEDSLRADMIIGKMRNLISETAELTSEENKMLESANKENRARLGRILLKTKGSKNVRAYVESMKKKLDIKVNRELVL